jgi:hypothetical protein
MRAMGRRASFGLGHAARGSLLVFFGVSIGGNKVIVVRLSGAADTNLPCIFVARLVAVDAWDFGQRNETSFIPDSIYRSEPITQYGTQQSVPKLVDLLMYRHLFFSPYHKYLELAS